MFTFDPKLKTALYILEIMNKPWLIAYHVKLYPYKLITTELCYTVCLKKWHRRPGERSLIIKKE